MPQDWAVKAANDAEILTKKVNQFALQEDEDSFLYTAPKLCNTVDVSGRSSGDPAFLTIRTWKPVRGGGSSAEEIIDLFNKKFAPTVVKLPGFKLYYGAVVRDETGARVAFFMNVFETEARATPAAATAAAH